MAKAVDSNQDTAYASSITYDIERVAVQNNLDLSTKAGQKAIRQEIFKGKNIKVPSNLNYLDSFYDSSTGTSGTAFKDTETGEVIIAYTGTNPKVEKQDIVTDVVSIGFGSGYHYDSAYQFYDKIAETYGSANLTLTGHSLGGNIAQRVALEKNAKNTIVYNAAPLYIPAASIGLITQNPALALAVAVGSSDSVKDIKHDRKTFTGKVTRLRTEWDPLNHASNMAGGVYIGDDYVIANSGGHSLDDIIGDRDQMQQVTTIVSESSKDPNLRLQETIHHVDDQLKAVQKLKNKYAAGGLTGSEAIYLDAQQATAVIQGLTTLSQEGVTQVAAEKEKALKRAEDTYDKLDDVPFGMILTPDEVKAAYAEAGCTYDSIVGHVNRHCSKTQDKFQDLADDFSELQESIAQAITIMVETDSEIAGMINAG